MPRIGRILFTLGLLLTCAPLDASVVIVDELPTMVRRSDVIARVSVVNSRITADGRGRPATLTTLEVIDAIKGTSNGKLLTVFQPGGTLRGVQYRVHGLQRFRFGDELVFFGVFRRDGLVLPYAPGSGLFRVVRWGNRSSVVELLTRDSVPMLRRPDGRLVRHSGVARTYANLVRFVARLRGLIAPQRYRLRRTRVLRQRRQLRLRKRGRRLLKRGGR